MIETDRGNRFASAYLGTFAGLLAFASAGLVAAARSGLTTPGSLLILCPSVVTAAFVAPLLLPRSWQERSDAAHLTPLLTLGVLFSPLLALATPPGWGAVYPLLGLVGLARALPQLRRATRSEACLLVVGAPLLALYLFAQTHATYAHLFAPELAQLGALNADTSMHATISQMILQYGTPSTGMDGVVPMHYHALSHAWFAAMAALSGEIPLSAYSIGQVVTAVPAHWVAAFAVTLHFAGRVKSPVPALLIVMAILLVFDRIGWTSYYFSESYTFGLSAVLLCLLLAGFWARPTTSPGSDALWIGVALAAAFFSAGLKLSVGFVFFAAFGYAVVRAYGIAWRSVVILALLGLVGLGAQ